MTLELYFPDGPFLNPWKRKKLLGRKKQLGNTETFIEPQAPPETAFLEAFDADRKNAWHSSD